MWVAEKGLSSPLLLNYRWLIYPNRNYADFDPKVLGTYTAMKGSSPPFKTHTYGKSIFNPKLHGHWSQNIGYVDIQESNESTFNRKYLLIINLDPKLHELSLKNIGYVGGQERVELTSFIKLPMINQSQPELYGLWSQSFGYVYS